MGELFPLVTSHAFLILCLFYCYLVLQMLAWSAAPLALIGKQRQSFYYEDLHHMHWERCTLAALPRLGTLLLAVMLPILVGAEYLFSKGAILGFVEDPVVEIVAVWVIRISVSVIVFVAVAAILGGLYFRIWRKEDHERRYQRFRDETLIMNAAYGPKHSMRQLMLLRPLPNSLVTRSNRPRI